MRDAHHVDLESTKLGIVLPVQARPRAKLNGITGTHDGALKVSVTQASEQGKANAALCRILAKQLSLKKSQVQLLSGSTSSQERFLLTEVDVASVQSRIAEVFGIPD